MLQNTSVIEIDDDDPRSQTVNSDSDDVLKFTKIIQKKVMKLDICLLLVNYSCSI